MAAPAFVAVGLTLLSLAAGCFAGAFCGTEPAKANYIYMGQVLLGITFAHARLVHPEWFGHGFFVRYWPVILMALAFTNAGISEWLRRRGRAELAEPFTNIGGFLPLVVVTGFAIVEQSVLSRCSINLSGALLLIGLMYASLAVARRSFVFSILAVAAANGALWDLLHHSPAFAFAEHPQLWLIPPALSILAAASFNRQRLTDEQMGTIRYLCLLVIYVSSTADVWINRDTASWLTFVLAALAAGGVFAGIALRVQSFLFLGSAFAFVAVAAMIRIAANQVHSNWPWLVAGILLGAVIVVTFALFEKKRTEMLGMLEKLKDWQK